MSERKLYSGHQAIEVVELMGMLAAQYNIHSETEALAIARKGAELLRDQQDEIKALALKLGESQIRVAALEAQVRKLLDARVCEECEWPVGSEQHKQHCPEAIRG